MEKLLILFTSNWWTMAIPNSESFLNLPWENLVISPVLNNHFFFSLLSLLQSIHFWMLPMLMRQCLNSLKSTFDIISNIGITFIGRIWQLFFMHLVFALIKSLCNRIIFLMFLPEYFTCIDLNVPNHDCFRFLGASF